MRKTFRCLPVEPPRVTNRLRDRRLLVSFTLSLLACFKQRGRTDFIQSRNIGTEGPGTIIEYPFKIPVKVREQKADTLNLLSVQENLSTQSVARTNNHMNR